MLFSCDYSYLIFSGYSYFLISSILDLYLSIPFSTEMRWVLSKILDSSLSLSMADKKLGFFTIKEEDYGHIKRGEARTTTERRSTKG